VVCARNMATRSRLLLFGSCLVGFLVNPRGSTDGQKSNTWGNLEIDHSCGMVTTTLCTTLLFRDLCDVLAVPRVGVGGGVLKLEDRNTRIAPKTYLLYNNQSNEFHSRISCRACAVLCSVFCEVEVDAKTTTRAHPNKRSPRSTSQHHH
jgi:hypothetical protein